MAIIHLLKYNEEYSVKYPPSVVQNTTKPFSTTTIETIGNLEIVRESTNIDDPNHIDNEADKMKLVIKFKNNKKEVEGSFPVGHGLTKNWKITGKWN